MAKELLSMDGFIRITYILVKVTLKIIEEVIRAILQMIITVAFVGVVMATGVMISYTFLSYEACNEDRCLTSRSVGGLILVAGWAFVAFATYTTLKRLF
ncbi:unnamed protein product [Colias eurytheme]|nr:unnamed protein product [Colias eurytheme]